MNSASASQRPAENCFEQSDVPCPMPSLSYFRLTGESGSGTVSGGMFLSASKPISATIKATVARDGFMFIPRWEASRSTSELATYLGTPMPLGKHAVAHAIIPKRIDTPNTYSGMYGLSDFPLHTDMAHWRDPPRYMMLRSIRGHASVATILADGRKLISEVGEAVLARALVKPRRPLNGSFHLLSLYRSGQRQRAPLLRWDDAFLIPASSAGQTGLRLTRAAIGRAGRIDLSLVERGDTLIVDNWRMLHGRSAVVESGADRLIERAYLGDLHE